jgi:hypothetical protein
VPKSVVIWSVARAWATRFDTTIWETSVRTCNILSLGVANLGK